MCLVIYWLEQIYPTNMMSYHEIGLRVSVVIKFYALDFHLVTQLFQKIWQRYLVKKCCFKCCLTLSWWRPLSYGNQSWFLYDIGLRHERVKKGWNAKRTVAAKKEIIHFFPFVNEEESVTFYDLKLIHFFIRLYFLWTTICFPSKFHFNLFHWLYFSVSVSANVYTWRYWRR